MFTNQPDLRRSLAILLLVVLSFTSIGSTLAKSFPDVFPYRMASSLKASRPELVQLFM